MFCKSPLEINTYEREKKKAGLERSQVLKQPLPTPWRCLDKYLSQIPKLTLQNQPELGQSDHTFISALTGKRHDNEGGSFMQLKQSLEDMRAEEYLFTAPLQDGALSPPLKRVLRSSSQCPSKSHW